MSLTDLVSATPNTDKFYRNLVENNLKKTVRNYHGFSQEKYEEALTHALHDPVDALTCFTSLAYKAELI